MKLKLLLILVLAFSPACSSLQFKLGEDSRIKTGNKVVNKIENFRKEKGRTPVSLSEIGIEEKEEGPIYYQRKDETRYILWFGKELGESVVYDSEKKKWE